MRKGDGDPQKHLKLGYHLIQLHSEAPLGPGSAAGVGNGCGGQVRPGKVRRRVIPGACAINERSQLYFGERSVDSGLTHGLWNEAAAGDRAPIHMKPGTPEHLTVPYLCLQKALKTKKRFL